MAFEIEEIVQTVKKNPIPWAIGLGVAVVGGYMAYRKSAGTGYVTEAYPELPQSPEDIAAGTAKPGDVTDAQLQELLAELERGRHEDLQQLAELNAQFMESLTRTLESYTSQQLRAYPQAPVQEPVQQISPELVQKAEYIYSTPSIVFHPQGTKYTPAQVETMYSWAVEEQAAISRGALGTSINPKGAGAKDMTVTYYPTGHVAFTPKGQSAPPTPSGYVSSALAQAVARGSGGASSWTSQQVSKVTGKTGTVEQQLSGMSTEQKISTLKKAGLI